MFYSHITVIRQKPCRGPTDTSCILCRSAVQDCWVHLQQPEAGKSATAVENLLHVTSAKDPSPNRLQQLQTSCSHFTPGEDPGAAGPRTSPPSAGSFYGPTPVWLGIWVDNAIIFLLDRSLSHLEKPGSTVRILFFDFSSAFNTIQPALLGDKLELARLNQHLTSWILDYLTNWPQYVRTQDYVSDTIICSTVAPHWTVLAPFLFTLYTADFYHQSPHCLLQKFSDNSAIVGLIRDGDDRAYRELIQDFVDCCQRNHLQLNAGKTKELVQVDSGSDLHIQIMWNIN